MAEVVRSFHISEAEVQERLALLKTAQSAEKENSTAFQLEKQLRCHDKLNVYERGYFYRAVESIEANHPFVAYNLLELLYARPAMKDEPKGLLALCVAQVGATDTPIAAVINNATPFSKVDLRDWAYYLALAVFKLEHNQYTDALRLVTLAENVPYHHRPWVSTVKADILQMLSNRT